MVQITETRKLVAMAATIALLVGPSLGGDALHINGTDADTVASLLNGADVILNNYWFSGTTLRFDASCPPAADANECNDDFTVRDVLEESVLGQGDGTCAGADPTSHDDLCSTVLVGDPVFTQGLVLCESNTLNPFVSDANAGYGGRCSSSDDAALSFTYDNWNSVSVTASIDAGGCAVAAGAPMTVFARVGNNAHGLEVANDQSFLYRDLIAFLVDGGHVTYFMKAEEVSAGSNQLDCFGGDEQTDIGAGSNLPASSVCNDLEESASGSDDGVVNGVFDAFQPWTYDPLASASETYDAQTVCVTGGGGVDPPTPTPVPCSASTLQVHGAPSIHAPEYDGPTQIQLVVGEGREVTFEYLDAPTVSIAAHSDKGLTHDWTITADRPGRHVVAYGAETSCPNGTEGPERLDIGYAQWTEGPACRGADGEGRYVVAFRTMPSLSLGSAYNGASVVHLDSVLKFVAVTVDWFSFENFLSATGADANVRYCESDTITEALHTPNDTHYGLQWGPAAINATAAWNTTVGAANVTICIVDSGVDGTHEDLRGTRWAGGYDFVDGDADPTDGVGHGTHVAGIAAATMDNSTGVAGIAQARILAARVLGNDGTGNTSWTASGIRWCTDQGADIINLSLGSPTGQEVTREAVDYAWDHGVLLVASTGNTPPAPVYYPAAFPHVLAVGSSDENHRRSSFSQFGSPKQGGPGVDVLAPGDGIFSTCSDGLPMCVDPAPKGCGPDSIANYSTCSGTSMAAPHVAGVAALVLSQVPSLTPGNLTQLLACSASDVLPEGFDMPHGYGIVDANRTLAHALAGTCLDQCSGTLNVTGLLVDGVYRGAVDVRIENHSPGGHAENATATATDGAPVVVRPGAHDRFTVMNPDHGTHHVVFEADLGCGATLTAEWDQFN